MVQIRFWQQSDLPYLLQTAGITAWEITPEDDKTHTTYQRVALNAQRNVIAILSSPYGTAIMAEDDGIPVGFLLLGIQHHHLSGAPRGYTADIYVEPPYRGHGAGKRMHLLGEAYFKSIGLQYITNWTHAHNRLGQTVSDHHGFRRLGLMMMKELQPVARSHEAGAGN
ncbi:MAG: N-acetyltransferase family protein [Mycobacterium leprae]